MSCVHRTCSFSEPTDDASVQRTSSLQLRAVLLSVQALLSAPNPDDPLATDVAKHYKEDKKDAQKVSREWAEKYASG